MLAPEGIMKVRWAQLTGLHVLLFPQVPHKTLTCHGLNAKTHTHIHTHSHTKARPFLFLHVHERNSQILGPKTGDEAGTRGGSLPPQNINSTAAHVSPHIKRTRTSRQPRQLDPHVSFPLLPPFDWYVWERETPTYLPHPGHSYLCADNGGPLESSASKRRSPRPLPQIYIHERITRGDADAVRLNALLGSINIGVYRYSSPLSVFFSQGAAGTWTDAALLLAGADAEPRPHCVTWPPLSSWLLLFQHASLKRGVSLISTELQKIQTWCKQCKDFGHLF